MAQQTWKTHMTNVINADLRKTKYSKVKKVEVVRPEPNKGDENKIEDYRNTGLINGLG